MPGAAASDIKLGFFIGVGLLLLALVIGIVTMVLQRAGG